MLRTPKNTSSIVFLSVFIGILMLSSCLPASPIQTATIPPTATLQPPTPTPEPAAFPFAGNWIGPAHNGNFEMPVSMEFNVTCQPGEVCGRFHLDSIPCSGTYTLVNKVDDFYEFRAGDFEGTCGIGKDYLQLLPDGKMQYTSRGDYGETTGILDRIIPVIYDDDGSPDGTTALMYLLSDARISVKAVNISYGEANPEVYIQYIGGLLDTFGFADIPLGAGQPPSLPGNHVFPDWIRDAADNFWGMPKPDTGKTYPVQDAAQLIVDTVNNAKEPITIFISGPCTNLAAALRLDPGIRDNIKAVYIMGGAVHVLGNLSDLVTDPENGWAEWNIYADAQAASEVFASGLEIYLVPLDATNEVTISNQDIAEWSKGAPQAVFAANFYQSIMGSDPAKEIYIWDIMTAEIMTQPYLCRFKDMEIQIVTKEGNNYGQTNQVVRGNPNAYVCVEPIIGEVRGQLDNIFRISH